MKPEQWSILYQHTLAGYRLVQARKRGERVRRGDQIPAHVRAYADVDERGFAVPAVQTILARFVTRRDWPTEDVPVSIRHGFQIRVGFTLSPRQIQRTREVGRFSVDLKWSAWIVLGGSWEERAPDALRALKRLEPGQHVTITSSPKKEIRYGTVEIARLSPHRWEARGASPRSGTTRTTWSRRLTCRARRMRTWRGARGGSATISMAAKPA